MKVSIVDTLNAAITSGDMTKQIHNYATSDNVTVMMTVTSQILVQSSSVAIVSTTTLQPSQTPLKDTSSSAPNGLFSSIGYKEIGIIVGGALFLLCCSACLCCYTQVEWQDEASFRFSLSEISGNGTSPGQANNRRRVSTRISTIFGYGQVYKEPAQNTSLQSIRIQRGTGALYAANIERQASAETML